MADNSKKNDDSTTTKCPSKAEIVCIHYNDLVSACSGNHLNKTDDIHNLIENAFSSTGLGIMAITDVPNLPELRLGLLPLAKKLATLPKEQLEEVTVHESEYQVGWVRV